MEKTINPHQQALAAADRERGWRQFWQFMCVVLALACAGVGIAAGAAQGSVRECSTTGEGK